MNIRKVSFVLAGMALTFFTACTGKPKAPTVWIYTSMYKDVIHEMEPKLKAKFPGVEFQWYQSGSENVAARLNAELSAGKPLADLVLTSDPYWYMELQKAGHLLRYPSAQHSKIPKTFVDVSESFAVVRMCVAVLAYNNKKVPIKDAPKSWEDLANPKNKGKVSMPSPLESGTGFNIAAQLSRKNGWPYFAKLRTNELQAAGGNSAVISRMETGERPIGAVLLENVLEAKKRSSPIETVYPKEGAILVPSPIAILAKTQVPELAKQVYDFFFDDQMQQSIVNGRMYSPIPGFVAPAGANDFKSVLANSFEWSPAVLQDIFSKRDEIKRLFSETVLN